MLTNIAKNGTTGPRVLVLAPDTPGWPPLGAQIEGGELDMLAEMEGIHIDALTGTVRLTGRNSLSDALRDGNYSLLHIISHGDCNAVRLTNESVIWPDLARLLSQHNIRLVLAMTCNSREFARGLLTQDNIMQVICTTGEIANEAARLFAREFYGSLVRNHMIIEAVQYARSRMDVAAANMVLLLPDEELPEEADPVLRTLAQMEARRVEWNAEVRRWMIAVDKKLDGCSLTQHEQMHALTQAVIHLTELLATR